jgi:hypothetical protein
MMYLSIALVGAQPAPFLISGLAVYDNAMPCNNLTLNITWGCTTVQCYEQRRKHCEHLAEQTGPDE